MEELKHVVVSIASAERVEREINPGFVGSKAIWRTVVVHRVLKDVAELISLCF